MFMTESQRRWAELQRDLATKKPAKLHAPLPDASYFRVLAFKLVDSSRFELAVLSLIMLNVALMACRWRGEPQSWANAMDAANHAFGLAFLLEAIVKLVGLGRSQYFSSYVHRGQARTITLGQLTCSCRWPAGTGMSLISP